MIGTMLCCVGVLLLGSSAVVAARKGTTAVLAHRVLEATPVPIARIVRSGRDGPVCLDGIVAAGERGTLVAPCSGRPVVWSRLKVWRNVEASVGRTRVTFVDEDQSVPFYVDDGSAPPARIATAGMRGIGVTEAFRTLPPEALERVRTFLTERGYPHRIADGYEEESIRCGDRVSVVGLLHRDATSQAPASVLEVEGASDQELIVAIPGIALRTRRRATWASPLLALLGIAAIAAGFVVRHWGVR